MADDEVNPLGTPTANYGWTKPAVGADVDAWGDMLNTDLDGIDSVVHGIQTSIPIVPAASTTPPVMDGVAAAGSSVAWARGDHRHPSDTTKYDANNPAGYITALAIPAPYVLPTASTTVLGGVKVDGTTITIASGTISGAGNYALPPASTTVLGGVKVDGTTIKAAVDGTISTTVVPLGDNRIINGDMRIDQRGVASGGGGTAVGYMCDRWQFLASLATKGGWGTGVNNSSFPYQLGFTSNSAYTLLAGDYFIFMQPIEADMISDFMWGTASARPVTLSFQVQSSLTGTFGGAIRNYASNRSYPFSYSIPVANVWTPVSITIPGDTGGTWVLHGNAGAAQLCFGFGCGSSLSAPAGAWVGSGAVSANGCVSILGTNGANFYLTGVKLEIGSVATPYNRQSLAKSMADCQRYYQTAQIYGSMGSTQVGQATYFGAVLPAMRAGATVTLLSGSAGNVAAPSYSHSTQGGAVTVTGTAVAVSQTTCNLILAMSAEL